MTVWLSKSRKSYVARSRTDNIKVIEVAQVKDAEHESQTDLTFNCLLKMQDIEFYRRTNGSIFY